MHLIINTLQDHDLVPMNSRKEGRKEVLADLHGGGTQTTMQVPQWALAQSGRQSLLQPRAGMGNPGE